MRILALMSEKPPVASGFARTVHEIQKGLISRHGHQVEVVSTQDAPLITFNKLKLSFIFIKLLSMNHDYDLIHINGNSPTFSDISLIVFHLFKKKIVYTYHCDASIEGTMRNKGRVGHLIEFTYNFIHRLLTRYASIVTFTTDSYSKKRRDYSRSYAIVPSGVDASFFSSKDVREFSKKPRKALFVGQLQPYKGLDLLIDAARGLNIEVSIAGKGKLFEYYKSKTKDIGNVKMLGFVNDSDLKKLYALAHFIILPSISSSEAFGLVTLEGMASGCIPITSDLPGVADLSRETGFIFNTGNQEDLRNVLRKAIELDDFELFERSERSKKFAQQFLWDNCVDLYNKVFTIASMLGRYQGRKKR